MNELIFTCNWGPDPEKAWSGTSIGLYKELAKYYKIEKMDINIRIPSLILFRCLEKLGLGRFDMIYMKHYSKVFKKKFQGSDYRKVFQFDECPDAQNAKSFLFLDLSVSFLLDVFENHSELVPYCGLENLSVKYLRKRSKAQKDFFKHTEAIFTMGEWLRDYLIDTEGVPADKVYAVGGGINVDTHQIDYSQKNGKRILFIGRDFQRKGGDIVVKAFHILKRRMPEAELYIAGPKSNPISEEDMIEGIYFLGEQNRKQVSDLYNKCDVFCMPSRFEAYGLVFAEALSYGLPCIARNAFSMGEFIQDGINGYLIDGEAPAELANKMELALHNHEMQAKVQAMKEFYIENYSWDSVVKRIVPVIEKS